MGRGRAKAKQVKVARQLKYNSGGTDLDRLRAELGVGADQHDRAYDPAGADRDDEDDDEAEEGEDDRRRRRVVGFLAGYGLFASGDP